MTPVSFKRLRSRLLADVLGRRLENRSFTIIADDCWGGTFYQALRIPYQTPLVGTQIMTPCFLRLVRDPQRIMRAPLVFKQESRYARVTNERTMHGQSYPIGELAGEVEILFMHYASVEQARNTWQRRLERVTWNSLYFKMDAVKLGPTAAHLDPGSVEEFVKVCPYRSVILADSPNPTTDRMVPLGDRYSVNGHDIFYLSLSAFDPCIWINEDVVRSSLQMKLLAGSLAPRFQPALFHP
jgi:uncharacterized protein (DUF1919 family)